MKRLLLAAALLVWVGCTGRTGNSHTGQDEMLRELAQKDSLLNEVFASLNDISANLMEIKDREGLVTANTAMDASLEQQAQIFSDIAAIDALLERNKAALAHLNDMTGQLRRSNVQVKELEALISGFAKQIQDKDADILELRASLESMQILVAELNVMVDSLKTDANLLNESNRTLENTLEQQIEASNAVYYIIGRERDLRNEEIIDKSGLIGRTATVNSRYNLDKFTQVDRRSLDRVLVGQRRATLITPHAAGSYQLEMGENQLLISVLITDPERFWESSKILVISYK